MPPKQVALTENYYTHQYNLEKFQENQNKFPIQFDKKLPKQFLDLYFNALFTMEMAPIPCLNNQLQQLKPLKILNIFSLIIDVPSCQLISQSLQESADVQTVIINDCIFSDESILAFFGFLNTVGHQVQNIIFIKLQSNLEPILQAIMFGQSKINLKIFNTDLSEKQIALIKNYVSLPYNQNMIGISLPTLIQLEQIPENLKYIEVNQQKITKDQVINQIDSISKEFDYEELEQFMKEYIFKQLIQQKDIKFADQQVNSQLSQIKQLLQITLQLIQTKLFNKYTVTPLEQMRTQMDIVFEQLSKLLNTNLIVEYLSSIQHQDKLIQQILKQEQFQLGQLEYLGFVNYQDSSEDINLKTLKAIGLGQNIIEATPEK